MSSNETLVKKAKIVEYHEHEHIYSEVPWCYHGYDNEYTHAWYCVTINHWEWRQVHIAKYIDIFYKRPLNEYLRSQFKIRYIRLIRAPLWALSSNKVTYNGINSKAAISLTLDSQCKPIIAALFFISYHNCCLI